MVKPIKGYVLWQGHGFDGADVVAIATGFAWTSRNIKTGDMVQVWILPADRNPLDAVKDGSDRSNCGECRFRSGQGCYVNVGQAPSQVWQTWQAGGYDTWDGSPQPFEGRKIRWGAYGDPVLIPHWIFTVANAASDGWTGYTHAWRDRPLYKDVLMASVDSPAERDEAVKVGWRTFRVRRGELLPGEFACPGSAEAGQRLTCAECMACHGAGTGASPAILPHGPTRGRLNLL